MKNKIKTLLLSGLLLLSGFCQAQTNDTYLVIDLTGGTVVPNYPISYLSEVPASGWTDAYKTNLLVLRKIPAGVFTMGSPTNEPGRNPFGSAPDQDPHSVTLTNDYYIGVFELTQGQWRRVVDVGLSDGVFPKGSVTVDGAVPTITSFLNNLKSRTANMPFSLPDEAQWEYACRAGTTNSYNYGSDSTNQLPDYAWYLANSGGATHPVGRVSATNAWGLYDMHGNVDEVCLAYPEAGYIMRSGRYNVAAAGCRSAARYPYYGGDPSDGFRLCLTVPRVLYTLTVTNGVGSGSYSDGQVVPIQAGPPIPLYVFDRWTGDTNTVADIFATNTTVTIPGTNIAVTATYRYAPYPLTVLHGSGTGQYDEGDVIEIVAEPAAAGELFDYWKIDTGDDDSVLGAEFVRSNAVTTVTMTDHAIILRAMYKPIPTYPLTVVGGTGTGSYTNGAPVEIVAPAIPEQRFTGWTASPAGSLGAGFVATNLATTLTMPAWAVTVTATYTQVLYTLTVNNGSGGGSYPLGQSVTVAVTSWPSAQHVFDRWTGDTNIMVNVFAMTASVTIAGNATLTPAYRPLPQPNNTYMVVDLTVSGTGSVSYLDVTPAGGWGETYKTAKMVFKRIPAGTFLMGSAAGESTRGDETQHAVTLTKEFYVGLFEVTQKQWFNVTGLQPSFYAAEANAAVLPVERVSYAAIRGTNSWPTDTGVATNTFVGAFRSRTGSSDFDLPTEAQWEYACRAGTTGEYAGSPLGSLAWYGNFNGTVTHEVGTKAANPWGLYDTHGNVEEICLDWYAGSLGTAAKTDPLGAVYGVPTGRRVMRGGWYGSPDEQCRSAYRGNLLGTNVFPWVGLRVARTMGVTYPLKVVNGVVNTGGLFYAGTTIAVSAALPAPGMAFGRWEVVPTGADLGAGFVETRMDNVITMPASGVTVTAVYLPAGVPPTALHWLRVAGSGVTSERLVQEGVAMMVAAPAAPGGMVFNGWTVTPAGTSLGAMFNPGSATAVVVMPTVDVTLTALFATIPPLPPVQAGSDVGVAFTLDAGVDLRPATFSAKGLPSGLRIDKTTGVISGVPTRSGSFTVVVTAKKADGTLNISTVVLTVAGLDAEAQGTFTGYAYRADEAGVSRVSGLVTLSASTAGKLSAKVTTQTTTGSFKAASWASLADGVYSATLKTTKGETLAVTVSGEDGSLTGVLSGGPYGEGWLVAGQHNAFANMRDTAAQAVLAPYKGYFTVALPVVACETDPDVSHVQNGSGYVTVTVRDRGVVSIAGLMADGARVSAKATLLVDADGAYVPLCVPLYSKRGVFSGLLRLKGTTGGQDGLRVEAHPDFLLEWLYPGSRAGVTADRFTVSLSAVGAYYSSQINLQEHYGSAVFAAEGQAWEVPLIVNAAGAVSLGAGADNPDFATLRVVKSTGLFSGTFKKLSGVKMVTLKHAGVLTRDHDVYIGEGAYVVPQTVSGYKLKPSYKVTIETK